MIRKGTTQDIDAILEITKACAIDMISKNIQQWNSQYPSRSAFKNDVARNELYVLEEAKKIIGCLVLSTKMDAEYETIGWLTPNSNNLYIHRVAIHPDYQGKGWARKLMDFAENIANKNEFTSIRLDTFSKNARNQKFYELRGYKKLGSIYFPKQSEHPFYCYEFVL
ncbi:MULTISPECIES: GNAT family N-acetyltransferase [Bizionia]|uniref:GNAT family N-acetyltransferase n=1 Tax=Bizionia algoritergicola TaxID=291187 RepID=A0A5D0R138_9FLAO|nr:MULTISPECIES: GNAT family N-acetyltransferase [Bizionia]OBX24277.1 GNAT family acetyltransferase [Bizionia sp. APA-3]TYB75197.1 GNAT family N-acetyltransferase [Bizionia algoritergicola]